MSGRGLVVGDAAGLADPVSGDGIFEAFMSAKLASATILELFGGRTVTLDPYADAVIRGLGPLWEASWNGKFSFDRFPRLSYSLMRTPVGARVIRQAIQGDLDCDALAGSWSLPLLLPRLLARRYGGEVDAAR